MTKRLNNRDFPDTIDYQNLPYRGGITQDGGGVLSYYHPQVNHGNHINEYPHLTIPKDVNALPTRIAFHVTGQLRNPPITIDYWYKGGTTYNYTLKENERLIYRRYYTYTFQAPNQSVLAFLMDRFEALLPDDPESNAKKAAVETYIKNRSQELTQAVNAAEAQPFAQAFQAAIDAFVPPQPQAAAVKLPPANAWGKVPAQVPAPHQNPAP